MRHDSAMVPRAFTAVADSLLGHDARARPNQARRPSAFYAADRGVSPHRLSQPAPRPADGAIIEQR